MTGPELHRERIIVRGPERGDLLDDAMRSSGPMSDFINEAVAKLIRQLDDRLYAELLALPPGTLLCVHTARTWMPEDLRGARLTVGRDTHVVARPDSECPEVERGRTREVHISPWTCRGCGRRATVVEGRACDECVNRFRQDSVRLGLDGMTGGPT